MGNTGYKKTSLTQRVKKLESMLRCEHARGQVYLRNFIDPSKRRDGPQITLRCRIREYLGDREGCLLNLEQIVLTCCRSPMERCEAYRIFAERTAAG